MKKTKISLHALILTAPQAHLAKIDNVVVYTWTCIENLAAFRIARLMDRLCGALQTFGLNQNSSYFSTRRLTKFKPFLDTRAQERLKFLVGVISLVAYHK